MDDKYATIPPLRVLHCPTTVGGNPQNLARSEREIGLQSWAVAYGQNYIGYQTDELLKTGNKISEEVFFQLKKWHFLWRALTKFDVIHFNCGQALLAMPQLKPSPSKKLWQKETFLQRLYRPYANLVAFRDLNCLHRAKKALFVTYQGDDARQGGFLRENYAWSVAHEVPDRYSTEEDALKQRIIQVYEKTADGIFYLNPDLGHVLPKRAQFMPYAHIDMRAWTPVFDTGNKRPLILHAPTNRNVKGTHYILNAVNQLQAEGIEFDFQLVENQSYTEAKKLYGKADLLIDQLLIGWYGGLAVELMALGKPVICFIQPNDLQFIPLQMKADMPLIQATHTTIYNVLKEYLTYKQHNLKILGQMSRAYVENWHNSLKIAAFLKENYITAFLKHNLRR